MRTATLAALTLAALTVGFLGLFRPTPAVPPARAALSPSPRPAAPAAHPPRAPDPARTLAAIQFSRAAAAGSSAADLNADGRIDAADAAAFHAGLSDHP